MKNTPKEYCPSCIKDFFNGNNINTLDFDKSGFMSARIDLKDTMSISGVQDKISLGFNDAKTLLPAESNGRYILKPQPNSEFKNFNDIPANEHLSMQLSASVFKIDTAKSALVKFKDGELAYITKRFDYISTENTIKYDQEDFCSVLDTNSTTAGKNYKYESSYEEISLSIDKYVAASRIAQEDFLRRVIFNFLISNGDAHLKNFSLIRIDKEMRLSPSYDLLNTRIHVNDGEMALDLLKDSEFTNAYNDLGFYSYADIQEFSKRQGIKKKRLDKIIDEIESYTLSVEEMIASSFLSEKMKELYMSMYKNNLDKKLLYKLK
jgi:serine/threonine-protein kinase HipA